MTTERDARVVLAGGGTGGHIIPALAIADALAQRGTHVRFVGTEDRIEARLVPQAGYGIDFIRARPLAGGGVRRKITGVFRAPITVVQCMGLLRRLAPDAVVGVGGYVAGPVVLAARLMGIRTGVLEQNATLGMSNRLLTRVVHRAWVSYAETIDDFPAGRAEHTGNPVKAAILAAAAQPPEPAEDERVRILVMGGSQGASAIDERVPAALSSERLASRVRVLHQGKAAALSAVQARYAAAGIPATTAAFIEDMAAALHRTDLVICRSGATTVAELTVMGLPAVFLPYPHHADRQQEKNAATLPDAGAALVVDEKPTGIAELEAAIATLVCDPERRAAAASAAKSLGKPDAAEVIATRILQLTGRH